MARQTDNLSDPLKPVEHCNESQRFPRISQHAWPSPITLSFIMAQEDYTLIYWPTIPGLSQLRTYGVCASLSSSNAALRPRRVHTPGNESLETL